MWSTKGVAELDHVAYFDVLHNVKRKLMVPKVCCDLLALCTESNARIQLLRQ